MSLITRRAALAGLMSSLAAPAIITPAGFRGPLRRPALFGPMLSVVDSFGSLVAETMLSEIAPGVYQPVDFEMHEPAVLCSALVKMPDGQLLQVGIPGGVLWLQAGDSLHIHNIRIEAA